MPSRHQTSGKTCQTLIFSNLWHHSVSFQCCCCLILYGCFSCSVSSCFSNQRYGSQLTKCVTNNIVKLIKFIIMIQLVTSLLISIRDALLFIKGHLLLPLNVYLLLPISSTYSKISRFCRLIHANFLSVYSSLFNNFRLNLLCFSCSTSFLLGLFHS